MTGKAACTEDTGEKWADGGVRASTFLFGPWLQSLPRVMKWTSVLEREESQGQRARRGRAGEPAGRRWAPWHPARWGLPARLSFPEELRGAECGGGWQRSMADGLCGVGGVGGVEGEGTAAKPGGRGAGGAEWEGRSWARIRSGRSTWLLPSHWAHFGTWCSLPPNPQGTDAWQPIPRGCGLG